jgi:hypothetical protein
MKALFAAVFAAMLATLAMITHAAPLPLSSGVSSDIQAPLPSDEDKDKDKEKKD